MGEFFHFGWIQSLTVSGPKYDHDLLLYFTGKSSNYRNRKDCLSNKSVDVLSLKEMLRDNLSNAKPNPQERKARRSWHEEGQDVCDFAAATNAASKIGHKRSQSDVPVDVLRSTQNNASMGFSEKQISDGQISTESGCHSVVAKTGSFFPQPEEGQSLTSFLSSQDFHTCAELDKENAHFYISEALIAAVEQIKCNQSLDRADEENEDESDEEIQHLKQRIRIRRRERLQEKTNRQRHIHLLSDGKTDTTSQSPSSPQSSSSSQLSQDMFSSDSEGIDELEFSDTTEATLSSIRDRGMSLSMASLYSDADIKRFNQSLPDQTLHFSQSYLDGTGILSAEAVALCLLKKFSEKQLPKASELEWLVSERDAPQRLLPLPDSWPVSPDEVEEQTSSQRTRLRGTLDWAPPRAQIIFSIQQETNKKIEIAKQNYRCAGCGVRTDKGYIHRFRFCKYLGKYFCQCCHDNSMMLIPAYVLHKWNFNRFPVSKFSRDLLERMHEDPLFSIRDINKALYQRRSLELVRQLRIQLKFLMDYVTTCRNANHLKEVLDSLPSHWILEEDIYSMSDLMQVKSGAMFEFLKQLNSTCITHVLNCSLCSSKGFICEVCRLPDKVIFPFQLNTVVRCKVCGTCIHKSCYKSDSPCSKCRRIQIRKDKLKKQVLSSEDET